MPNTKFKHVMLDLETLSTRPDAVIISIGAVKFNLDSGEIGDDAFYASVSIDSNFEAAARHISEDTLGWWFTQSQSAQKVFSEEKITLFSALEDFSEWATGDDVLLDKAGESEACIWSNGADFDIPMLAHAFHTNGLHAPWKFWNSRCFRTMKSLPQAKGVPKPTNQCAHNALQDAITQALWLIEINKKVCA